MNYPIVSTRSQSPKPSNPELRSLLLDRDSFNDKSNYSIKLPCISTILLTQRKSQRLSNDTLKSILQKSVSLDLTKETRKRALKSTKKSGKDNKLGDHLARINRFNHYVNYIESLGEDKPSPVRRNKLPLNIKGKQAKQNQTKSEMPSIRVQKLEYHSKHRSINISNMSGDETFIRMKSPGCRKWCNHASKLIHTKLMYTIQHQQSDESKPVQKASESGDSKNPVRGKKQRILSKLLVPTDQKELDILCAPWQYQIYDDSDLLKITH